MTNGNATGRIDADAVGQVFRAESGRSVATLIRVLGDIDAAEDAVQDAFLVALRRWPDEGLPADPGRWITTTARNRAIDHLRRESRGRELLAEPAASYADATSDELEQSQGIVDDRLRLIFTCCHPALSAESQVALTLRLLGGLTTDEVARAFLVSEPTMAQRLVRAKRKIKAARIPYRVPGNDQLAERLQPVLTVNYLIYNAGANLPGERERAADDLCHEALRLTRLYSSLMPDEPEVAGLLALLLMTESRRGSRLASDGSLVLLADQDRAQWDRVLIAEGQRILRWCLACNRPGPYQLQAAINAVHTQAESVADTDWPQILTLYDHLLAIAATPVVALNRAIAVGEVHGASKALALVDELQLDEYHPFHATRADLLRRLGRRAEAGSAYRLAASLARTTAERDFLNARARQVTNG